MLTEPVCVTHWERVQDFNPHSWQQVGNLIRHLGLAMPKKRGEDRETTEAKYLRRFSKKHPVFRLILECRERQKMLTTYMWPLDEEGRVHTTYGRYPSTWRFSSRAVNLQNIPKRVDLAAGFRRMLIARPGHVLIEADAEAIEAVLVGYSAGSDDYVRLAKAGVHGWLTSHLVGRPIPIDLPLAELRARCQEMKHTEKQAYEPAKRVIHGANYGLTPFGVYDEFQEHFPGGLKQAKALHALYFSLPPVQPVVRWQRATMERAHHEGYLDNHFGYRHYFYDVFSFDRKQDRYVLGTDAKRAIAFIPQSDASAIQTEILLTLAQDPRVLPWMRLIVHDNLVLEVSGEQQGYAVETVQQVMTRPWPELGGLDVGVEIKVGRNLAPFDAVENPDGMREV